MGRLLPSPLVFSLAFASAALAQEATVLGITGMWKQGGAAVHFGSKIPRNALLSCEPGSTLMVAVGGSPKPAHLFGRCKDNEELNLGGLEQNPDANGWLRKLLSAFQKDRHHAESFVSALSRGGWADLADAIAPLGETTVDLTVVVAGAGSGPWTLRATPLDGGTPFDIQAGRSAEQAVTVPIGSFRPGLYRIATPAAGEADSDAWVLVCASSKCSAVSAQFRLATAAALTTWEGLGSRGVRPMLRAYLEALAEAAR